MAALVALTAGLAAAVPGVLLTPPSRGAAQAEFVVVSTRTTPELPQAGDDVTVSVRARGCPPGGARVEVYLRTDDGASASDALMLREEVGSTLFFRVIEELELPAARTGWYGVRVVCGQFRPERGPMPNTWFVVGEPGPLPVTVTPTAVVPGQSVRLQGEGCDGGTLEYGTSRDERRTAFVASGGLPVSAAGTFDGTISVDEATTPGPLLLRLRCTVLSPFGDDIWQFFGPTVLDVAAP